jgi:hypothetical protein
VSDGKEIVHSLHRVLAPVDFKRTRRIWNRRTGSLVCAIDVQTAKGGDALTINVGVADVEVYEFVWGKTPPKAFSAAHCPVSTRLGFLIDGYDHWWNMDEIGAVEDATNKVEVYALPFLDRLSSRDAMRQWLVDRDVEKLRYPPPIISLAYIEYLLGERSRGHERLSKLQAGTSGEYSEYIGQLAERLCLLDKKTRQ